VTNSSVKTQGFECLSQGKFSNLTEVEDWKQIAFSDESPSELFHPHDGIWAPGKEHIEHVFPTMFSLKVMVWGAMCFSGLFYLHNVPQGQTINQEYYCQHILIATC
jgi:hypothetical protein